MGLKLASNYTPNVKLRWSTKPVGVQGSTYNPQKTVKSSKLQGSKPKLQGSSYNPQRTVSSASRWVQPAARASQLNRVTAQQFAAQMRRQQIAIQRERARKERIRKRRLRDAKLKEIRGKSTGWLSDIGDKVSFGDLRRQRGGREIAVKYLEENYNGWGTWIMAKQTNYEERAKELKAWAVQAIKSKNEGEYIRRAREANAWLKSEFKEIKREIKDYNKTQAELAGYSQTPLPGKLPAFARTSKNFIGNVTGTSWNALNWSISQPQRAAATAKNIIKPENLRIYHGGEEKKGGLFNDNDSIAQRVRKAYNASRDQRLVAYSKDDEARRLESRWIKRWVDGKQQDHYYDPDNLAKWRIRYGDDLVDMIADPASWIPAGAFGKGANKAGSSALKFLGKSKTFRGLAVKGLIDFERLKKSRFGQGVKWLGEEWKPRKTRAKEAVDLLSEDLRRLGGEYSTSKRRLFSRYKDERSYIVKSKSNFFKSTKSERQRLQARRDFLKNKTDDLTKDFVKRLDRFSDDDVRRLTRAARSGGKWTTYDKLKLNKHKRRDLEQFLKDYQVKARSLADAEQLNRRASNYLPEFTGRGYDPTARRTLFGNKYRGQGRGQLQESLIMREFASNTDEANSFIKQLSATEKSILRNAGKTQRGLTTYEQKILDTVRERKVALQKLTESFGKRREEIQRAMEFTRQQAKPAVSFSRKGGFQTNLTKQGFKNTAADTFRLPQKLWKKAVLKYNPAWYANNVLWNIPASVSAGGSGVFKQYRKLLTSSKYRNEVTKSLPEGVASKVSQQIGKAGLATKIEDTSRIATFLANREKGLTDDKALKLVNRWLFDYSTKNWERPIKHLLPFWEWQKNLIRLGGTMPFTNPRSAKFYNEAYNKFYRRPYEDLPNEVQEYEDPLTGEKVEYNPRKAYEGKAFLGKDKQGNERFANLPFFAVNPETMLNFGTNPYYSAAMDYMTSTDKWERPNTDRSGLSILGERFPQYNLARNYAKRNDKRNTLWFSESGNSKSKQGFDESKPNYDKKLDERIPFRNSLKSFFGIPRVTKFNRSEYELKKRLTNFNKAFFDIDWDKKEEKDWKKAQKEKEQLAKKFGFDLEKDIYKNYWSKYDTPKTKETKAYKEDAAKFGSDFWQGYFKLPAGSKTQASQRRPYLIKKFDEWVKKNTFSKNPYYKLPKWEGYKDGKPTGKKEFINPFELRQQEVDSQERRRVGRAKYERYLQYQKAKRTGDWSWFEKNGRKGGRKSSPYQYNGKFFKSAASTARYRNYHERFRSGFNNSGNWKWQKDGKFFKSEATMKKYEAGKFWAKYYSLTSLEARKKLLAKNPQFQSFTQPKTQAEWDKIRAKIRADQRRRAEGIKGFTSKRKRLERGIRSTLPSSFGDSRRLRYK